jgi:ketosteroid isomerase-like protein
MDKQFAERFASDWIAAWNAHDMEGIVSHYSQGFEMAPPVIQDGRVVESAPRKRATRLHARRGY